jgi:cytochrome c5
MNGNTAGKFLVGSILTILILFGLVLIILNNMQTLNKNATAPESMEADAVQERIKPTAEVNVGEPPVIAAAPAATDDGAAGPGKDTVDAVCAACHAAGLMGSPKLGNAEDWAPRIEKGIDTLHKHALEGFNMMPAKGGRGDLPDADIEAAVDYMVSLVKGGSDAPAADAAAPAETSAAPAADETDMTAGKETVDAVCATCHASGLMNAPKLGNAEDWAPRIEKGMDTLHKHALEGFNMMPAKGGRADLPDADIEAAVDYMVSLAK